MWSLRPSIFLESAENHDGVFSLAGALGQHHVVNTAASQIVNIRPVALARGDQVAVSIGRLPRQTRPPFPMVTVCISGPDASIHPIISSPGQSRATAYPITVASYFPVQNEGACSTEATGFGLFKSVAPSVSSAPTSRAMLMKRGTALGCPHWWAEAGSSWWRLARLVVIFSAFQIYRAAPET